MFTQVKRSQGNSKKDFFDVLIIGAGILGVTLAFWLSELYDASIAIIDKEESVAFHTSSRNTGVVHRPFYLNPSSKSVFAKSSQKSYFLWSELASRYGLPWRQCGTIEVALKDPDLSTLEKYTKWAAENGMAEDEVEILDHAEVRKLEREVDCKGAIHSKNDTSVDYGEFASFIFGLASKNGVQFIKGAKVENVVENHGNVEVFLRDRDVESNFVINAAGGGALDIAHSLEIGKNFADLHFRGEYWFVDEPFASRVSGNVYSVPKYRDFPFLDPHYIVRASGKREIGPNAVLVSGPGVYKGLSNSESELVGKIFERPISPKLKLFTSRRFLSLVWSEWQSSTSKEAMCRRVQQFIPSIDTQMLGGRGLAGVRTSLIDSEGKFVPEAVLLDGRRSIHVLNYNSPGATGAPAFSAYVVKQLVEKGHLNGLSKKDASKRKYDSLWSFDDAVEAF